METREEKTFLEDYADSLREDLENFDTKERQKQYQDMLGQYSTQPSGYNFFDLATDLSKGLSAQMQSDRPNSLAGGLALGFNQASDTMQNRQAAYAEARRAIGLEAARLAMQDRNKAEEYLNKALLELSKTDPSNKIEQYLYVGEEPLVLESRTYQAGDIISLNPREARKYRNVVTGGIGTGFSSTASGSMAVYMSRADAIDAVKGLGLNENLPTFNKIVEQITAPTEQHIGRPVIVGGTYTSLVPLTQGGAVFNIMLKSLDGKSPPFEISREARLKGMAKTKDTYMDKVVNVLPAVDRGLSILMSGTSTGLVDEAFVETQQVLSRAFGTFDEEVSKKEDLMSLSFFLGPKMRPVGSGSTSDMEFKAYMSAILALGKTPEANYMSLFAYKRMTENSIKLNMLEEELLSDPSIQSQKEINARLKEVDTGLFDKVPEDIDINDEDAILAWFNSLPDGAVIDNADGYLTQDGKKLSFIIKGWNNRGK